MAFLKQHSTPTFQLVIHVYGPDGEKPKKLVKTQWLLAGYLDVFDLLRRHPHPDRFLYQVISSVGRSFIAPALYASGSTCKFCKHPVVRMWSHLAKITRREVTIKSLPLCGDPACLQSEKFKDFLREIQQDVNVPACVCVSCGHRVPRILYHVQGARWLATAVPSVKNNIELSTSGYVCPANTLVFVRTFN